MKNNFKNENAVGVIIGRFQVAELHQGHLDYINFALSQNHDMYILLLGLAPTKATKRNPLDFDSRRRMIEEAFPGKFIIMYQNDLPDDKDWANAVIKNVTPIAGNRDIVIYGGRDNSLNYFPDTVKIAIYEPTVYLPDNGTEQRISAGKQVKSSKDWRLGCLYATQNRYDTVFPTVDCAIFDDNNYEYIYLAKKEKERKLRFVGGFADPNKDKSFEQTARREAYEETGLEVTTPIYIGSTLIDDWRYRSENDKIITSFFAINKVFGSPKAQDDIAELHKIKVADLYDELIVPEHRPLLKMLKEWLKNKK